MIHDHRPEGSIGLDGEGVYIAGSLFDDNEHLAIWADRDRRSAGVGGSESGGGVGNLLKATETVCAEGYDSAVSTRVKDIDSAVTFRDGDREGSACWLLIGEDGQTSEKMEAGDGAASRVDREEQVMVMAEGERTLRLEWIGSTAAAAAASCSVCLENGYRVGRCNLIPDLNSNG